jgi:hypothetical protein
MARLSLAEQLAELSNAAPAPELDPEAEADERGAGDDAAEAREHYTEVGCALTRMASRSTRHALTARPSSARRRP